MAKGGFREGAGRKPNAVDKISKDMKERALSKYPDFNPLADLIDFYHQTLDPKLRLQSLEIILKKYVPDLKAIDHSSSDGTAILPPIILRPTDFKAQSKTR